MTFVLCLCISVPYLIPLFAFVSRIFFLFVVLLAVLGTVVFFFSLTPFFSIHFTFFFFYVLCFLIKILLLCLIFLFPFVFLDFRVLFTRFFSHPFIFSHFSFLSGSLISFYLFYFFSFPLQIIFYFAFLFSLPTLMSFSSFYFSHSSSLFVPFHNSVLPCKATLYFLPSHRINNNKMYTTKIRVTQTLEAWAVKIWKPRIYSGQHKNPFPCSLTASWLQEVKLKWLYQLIVTLFHLYATVQCRSLTVFHFPFSW